MSCDTFFLGSPIRRVTKRRGSHKPPTLNNNTGEDNLSHHHRPNSWSGVLQKLLPRRSAPPPPPPPQKNSDYAEVNKTQRADTGEYCLAEDSTWFDNPAGEILCYIRY